MARYTVGHENLFAWLERKALTDGLLAEMLEVSRSRAATIVTGGMPYADEAVRLDKISGQAVPLNASWNTPSTRRKLPSKPPRDRRYKAGWQRRLREWMATRRMSHSELASRLGVTTQTVRNWTGEISSPPIARAIELDEICGGCLGLRNGSSKLR